MKWHGLRIPVVFLSLTIGLALFFGCQWLYQTYSYKQPLEVALKSNKAVKDYKIDDQSGQLKIEVQMSTPNLMDDYKKLYDSVSAVMENKQFTLKLKDNRDQALKEAYYNSQYAIYQAISQGSYQEMAVVIRKEAGAVGAGSKVFIDRDNIYVQMEHKGHRLNEIISRNPQQPVISASMGGGVQS